MICIEKVYDYEETKFNGKQKKYYVISTCITNEFQGCDKIILLRKGNTICYSYFIREKQCYLNLFSQKLNTRLQK